MADTSIEWTSGPNKEPGYTFNPWLGCAKAHTGCLNCYAERAQPVVMRKGGGVTWGEAWQGGQRVVVSEGTWRHPHRWAREAAAAGQRRKVFCASLADVLEVPLLPPERQRTPENLTRVAEIGRVLDDARNRLWDTIRKTATVWWDGTPSFTKVLNRPALMKSPGLDWLILTKRPENADLVPEDVRRLVWLGTSISSQETAEQWVPRLLSAQGFRYRFLSIEPLVGPVDLRSLKLSPVCETDGETYGCGEQPLVDAFGRSERCGCTTEGAEPLAWHGLDWVIVGGESGSKARPCNVEWVRSIVEQCHNAGVPCFVKQLGTVPLMSDATVGSRAATRWDPDDMRLMLNDHKGRDMSEWPEDLRVRQWPGVR
jgi:protein gp37